MHAIVMVHKMQRMALSSHTLLPAAPAPGGQQHKPESVAKGNSFDKESAGNTNTDSNENCEKSAGESGEWPD